MDLSDFNPPGGGTPIHDISGGVLNGTAFTTSAVGAGYNIIGNNGSSNQLGELIFDLSPYLDQMNAGGAASIQNVKLRLAYQSNYNDFTTRFPHGAWINAVNFG